MKTKLKEEVDLSVFMLGSIHYLSDPLAEYVKDLDAAVTLEGLRGVTTKWAPLCGDACGAVSGMTEDDFTAFRNGLYLERHGRFAGEQFASRYDKVLMPDVLFRVGMVAEQFGAPWGLAYIRLREAGKIVESEGVARAAAQAAAQAAAHAAVRGEKK